MLTQNDRSTLVLIGDSTITYESGFSLPGKSEPYACLRLADSKQANGPTVELRFLTLTGLEKFIEVLESLGRRAPVDFRAP